jgi:hypothetical protein
MYRVLIGYGFCGPGSGRFVFFCLVLDEKKLCAYCLLIVSLVEGCIDSFLFGVHTTYECFVFFVLSSFALIAFL